MEVIAQALVALELALLPGGQGFGPLEVWVTLAILGSVLEDKWNR